jgi:hypothetical protein
MFFSAPYGDAVQLVQEKARSQALVEKLRSLGVDPDGV